MSPDANSSDPRAGVPDASLLAAITQGDEAAMAGLYARHATRIYSVALRVLRDANSAEEVLQEVFLQIWRNPAGLRDAEGSLAGRLAVAARHCAVDVMRGRESSGMAEDDPQPSSRALLAEVDHERSPARVRQGLASLPPEQQMVLEMAFFLGLTPSEIADRTGATRGTVKTRIRVALQALSRAFQAGG